MSEKKKNRLNIKGRLSDLGAILGIAGVSAGLEFLDGSLDYTYGHLALGSGFIAGIKAGEESRSEWSTIYTSLGVLAGSMYPQVTGLVADGDVNNFVTGVITKGLAYGAGMAIGGILGIGSNMDYKSVFDLEAKFNTKHEAQRVYDTLCEILNVGNVSWDRSSLSEPEEVNGTYRITAKIVGKTNDMVKRLQPQIKKYLTETQKPLEAVVSDVITT